MIVFILEITMFVIVLTLIFTQVIDPYIKGKAFFPLLRKEVKLYKDIVNLNQESHELDMENKIIDLKQDNEKKRKSIKK